MRFQRLISRAAAVAAASMMLAPFASAGFNTDGVAKFNHPEKEALDQVAKSNEIGLFNRTERRHKDRQVVKKNGKVLEVSSTMLKIAHFKKDDQGNIVSVEYTFKVDANTKLIRKFKGVASWGEVAVGDRVQVWADKLVDGTAKLVWDKSIWWAKLRGLVADLDDAAMTFNVVLTRTNDEGQTKSWAAAVKGSSVTEVFKTDGTAGTWDDLANDQKVSVRGSWNSVGKYLLARKVFILP